MDAHDNVAEQDASLLGTVIEQGRAVVLAVNKWDNIPRNSATDSPANRTAPAIRRFCAAAFHFGAPRQRRRRTIRRRAQGVCRRHPRHEHPGIDAGARSGDRKPSAAAGQRRRIKLRYAHQGGRNPPIVVIHGNQTDHVPDAYPVIWSMSTARRSI